VDFSVGNSAGKRCNNGVFLKKKTPNAVRPARGTTTVAVKLERAKNNSNGEKNRTAAASSTTDERVVRAAAAADNRDERYGLATAAACYVSGRAFVYRALVGRAAIRGGVPSTVASGRADGDRPVADGLTTTEILLKLIL